MADRMEGVIISDKNTLPGSVESSLGRELKILGLEQKALDFAWVDGIDNAQIEFPAKNDKVVIANEVSIPLRFSEIQEDFVKRINEFAQKDGMSITNNEIQETLEDNEERSWLSCLRDYGIPDRINKIRIVDFSPQEAFPRKERSIDSGRDWQHDLVGNRYPLNKITDQPSENKIVDRALWIFGMRSKSAQQRSEAMEDLLYDVFGGDKQGLEKFKEIIKNTKGDEILMIHGHGGYGNIIGEQTSEVKGEAAKYLEKGNWIDLSEIIDVYDDPDKFAAILINTCYLGSEDPPVKRVPVFRPKGLITGNRNYYMHNINKVLISEPSKI